MGKGNKKPNRKEDFYKAEGSFGSRKILKIFIIITIAPVG
jgi:hypothetical protein